MKKLSWRFRGWLIHRCRPKRKTKIRFGELTTQYGTQQVRLSGAVNLPANLCLDHNTHQTLSFFAGLRYRTLLRGIRSRPGQKRIAWVRGYTDFSTMRRISPGAALILAAEYDRIHRVGSSIPNTVDLKRWDPAVYSTLYNLGFFDLVGVNKSNENQGLPSPAQGNFIQAPMQRGENANWQSAGDALLYLFERVGGDDAARVNLLGAVVDAIENVRGHAYAGRGALQTRLIPPFWWLSGAVDQALKKLTLSIYDQGVTIPVTLPNNWAGAAIVNAFVSLFGHTFDPKRSDYDGEALRAAMQLSSTATGLTQRGKGLSKIRDVVAQCKGGRLKVISRRGIYTYENGTEAYQTSSIPLLGTFVEIEATF